jgi:hypothetical protein
LFIIVNAWFYFTGWATEAELLAHLDKLYDQPD